MLSGYYLLLQSFSNQEDIVIGTPVANRNYPQLENLIGFFVNSLALRMNVDQHAEIRSFIREVGQVVIEAQVHQDLPFEKVVEELRIASDHSRNPLFQVLFSVQSFGNAKSTMSKPEILAPAVIDSSYTVAKFDLTTMIDDSSEQLQGNFNYAISLFNESTIQSMVATYVHLLGQLSKLTQRDASSKRIRELSYLAPSYYKQVMVEWTNTAQDYPLESSIAEVFARQVAATPNALAVVCEAQNEHLSYQELNQRANRLAHYLKRE